MLSSAVPRRRSSSFQYGPDRPSSSQHGSMALSAFANTPIVYCCSFLAAWSVFSTSWRALFVLRLSMFAGITQTTAPVAGSSRYFCVQLIVCSAILDGSVPSPSRTATSPGRSTRSRVGTPRLCTSTINSWSDTMPTPCVLICCIFSSTIWRASSSPPLTCTRSSPGSVTKISQLSSVGSCRS
jgi:hypothetical protein